MTDTTKTSKKKSHKAGRILKLLKVVPALFTFFGHLFSLMRAELSQIRRQLAVVIILTLFLLVLIFTVWISLNALLFLYLVTICHSVACAIGVIALANFMLLLLVSYFIATRKFNATLPETRKVISDIFS